MSENPYTGPDSQELTQGSEKRFSWLSVLVVCSIVAILIVLFLPFRRDARQAARRTQCSNNLKRIAFALHNYAEVNRALPPAYTVDDSGRPLHSWRTLILPYLDQQELFEAIDLTKTWDDPVNAQASETSLSVFRCPSATIPDSHTTYVGLKGINSCFHPDRPRPFSEITDGISQTAMVIEVSSEQSVHWMAPQDHGAEFLMSFGTETDLAHTGGTQVSFADGSVHFLLCEISDSERRDLISIASGGDENTVGSDVDRP